MPKSSECLVPGCDSPSRARGRCMKHYRSGVKSGEIAVEKRKETRLDYIKRVVLPYAGDDCLYWPFVANNNHYPVILYEGRVCNVSRVVCILTHGKPRRRALEAAHACGNGHLGCVNPRHIRWKTKFENLRERKRPQWSPPVLTPDDVRRIRSSGESVVSLAERLGISVGAVSRAKRGVTWKDVA